MIAWNVIIRCPRRWFYALLQSGRTSLHCKIFACPKNVYFLFRANPILAAIFIFRTWLVCICACFADSEHSRESLSVALFRIGYDSIAAIRSLAFAIKTARFAQIAFILISYAIIAVAKSVWISRTVVARFSGRNHGIAAVRRISAASYIAMAVCSIQNSIVASFRENTRSGRCIIFCIA
jgi:hypothetical protein